MYLSLYRVKRVYDFIGFASKIEIICRVLILASRTTLTPEACPLKFTFFALRRYRRQVFSDLQNLLEQLLCHRVARERGSNFLIASHHVSR